ncbi:MAG TPA: hypothetical protein VFH22_03410 [Rhodocyclaceae bacterium]|nr:hypothetical protein [Rhodocyclaceae bacterium]
MRPEIIPIAAITWSMSALTKFSDTALLAAAGLVFAGSGAGVCAHTGLNTAAAGSNVISNIEAAIVFVFIIIES